MFNAIRRWIQGAIASTVVKQAAYIDQLEREADKDVDRYTQALNHNLELMHANRELRRSHQNIFRLQLHTFKAYVAVSSELEEAERRSEDYRRLYNEAYDESIVLTSEIKSVRITNGQLAELNMKKQETIEFLEAKEKKNLAYYTNLETTRYALEKQNKSLKAENESLKAEVEKLRSTVDAVHKNLLESVAEIAGY